jgi:hypothetical protein
MNPLDSSTRMIVLMQGKGLRWLRDELEALQVRIPLTEGCLRELFRAADAVARQPGGGEGPSYVQRLRKQLAACARFVHHWTDSDDRITALHDGESLQELVRIARSYSLPRPWKLSEPIVVEYRRMNPSYLKWASDTV